MSKTLAEMIAVMQAAERGEPIERSSLDGWIPAAGPTWNWGACDYRAKAQPKVIWVNEYPDQNYYTYESRDVAAAKAGGAAIRKAVKYVEVQD